MSRRKKSHQSQGSSNRPRFWGKHAVTAALDNPERKVLRAWATREVAGFMQFPKDVQVTLAEAPDLGRLVPHDAPHQGVVIEVEPLEDAWLDDLLAEAPERAVLLVLDQVTDPHNVGAILRSAEVFGARAVIATARHAAPETGALAKTASGALERQPYLRVTNLADALTELKAMGYTVLGLDGTGQVTLPQALEGLKGRALCLVLGAEGPGLREKTLETCDQVVRIPFAADFGSLNVSNAAAVAVYAASTG